MGCFEDYIDFREEVDRIKMTILDFGPGFLAIPCCHQDAYELFWETFTQRCRSL
jgi:hypothetical protein